MNPLRKALEDGHELIWCKNDNNKTALYMKDGKLRYYYNSSNGHNEDDFADESWNELLDGQHSYFTIGGIKFPKSKTIAEALSNHAKCIRCKDEIFMGGADRKDFVCYRCRN